jgi:hypothetical protein
MEGGREGERRKAPPPTDPQHTIAEESLPSHETVKQRERTCVIISLSHISSISSRTRASRETDPPLDCSCFGIDSAFLLASVT